MIDSRTTAIIDTLPDIDGGVWTGLGLNQIWPRPGIIIHQNRVRAFATFGARAAQTHCPNTSNIGQKCLVSDRSTGQLEVRFIYLGWTAAFYSDGIFAIE